MHRNVPWLGWGMLHYGIRASSSNNGLERARTHANLMIRCCILLSVQIWGEMGKKKSEIPQNHE
jgi:hypothetical protein